MELIASYIILYTGGAIVTFASTMFSFKGSNWGVVSAGAAFWWPIVWVWFIFHSGIKFIDWANDIT